MKQIVTINTNHICPMVTGFTPHVGGPIVGPGNSGVLIDGTPVSVLGDTCVCVGPPDVVVQGYSGVLADGIPVTVQNCMTAHGGVIPMGIPGVIVSNASPVTIKHKSPKSNKTLAFLTGNSGTLSEAIVNQNNLQKESKKQKPLLYNVHWEKEDIYVNRSKDETKVYVVASVIGIDDGDSVDFEIVRVLESDQSEKVFNLSGVVNDSMVRVKVDIEKLEYEIPES